MLNMDCLLYVAINSTQNKKTKKETYTIKPVSCYQDLSEGGSAGTAVRGPKSQKRVCESLKGPIALVIDVLF